MNPANCNEKFNDHYAIVILFNYDVYNQVKTILKYGRISINCEEITTTLKSKDLKLKLENTRGRKTNINSDSNNKFRNKSRGKSM